MLKKKSILFLTLSLSFLITNAKADSDTSLLTGDTKLSCEAILCLSSPSSRPHECEPSIHAYYSIKAKKWSKTVKKRKKFLDLCPMESDSKVKDKILSLGQSKDPELRGLYNVLGNMRGHCDTNALNSNVETRNERGHFRSKRTYYRVSRSMPRYCNSYYNHPYFRDQKPKYVCDSRWVEQRDWNRGYSLVYPKRKVPVEKNCWR